MRKLFVILSAAILTACGGGGGTGGVTPTPTPVSLFSPTSLSMPDLSPYFTQMCGDLTGTRVTLADLNKDGKQDLIVTFNCHLADQSGTNLASSATTLPANGGMVIFLQQSNGSFVDSTQAVLGTSFYHVNGLTGAPTLYDFNGDGYVDIVFPVSNEDGRLPSDSYSSNFNEPNLFLMSNGNGTYTPTTNGSPAWNYYLELADNANGSKDLIVSPIGYLASGYYGMTYQNGWSMTSTNYSWAAGSTVFYPRTSSGTGSTMAIVPTNNLTVTLYENNNGWSAVNTIDATVAGTTVPTIAWNGNPSTTKMLTINGVNYFDPALENSCLIKLKQSDTVQTAIFTMVATRLNIPYTMGAVLNEPSFLSTDTTQTVTLLGFTVVNNAVVQVPLNINNQLTTMAGYSLMCGDFNGDGNDDIAVSDWQTGSIAAIYINDGNGNFDRVSASNVPGVSTATYSNGNAFIIADINGDGIMDLLYYPVNGAPDGTVKLNIFLGNRKIVTSDLM